MKRCSICKKDSSDTEFGKDFRRCKGCNNKRMRERYLKDPKKIIEYSMRYYRANKEACIARNKKNESALKDAVFMRYGGYLCKCCGETIKEFLTIDHINGGGTKHRKLIGGGGRFHYRWIRNNGYPEGFRVLCINCNFGRSRNKEGICPHEIKKAQ